MSESYASAEECRPLYELMAKIKEMAPWTWMGEDDIFSVQFPGSDEPGFVSIMGTLGEHLAISVYLGAKGLYGFRGFQEKGPLLRADDLLAVPQLQASFEGREATEKRDRDIAKTLGYKFRGAQAWVLFREYRAAMMPWFITPDQASKLRVALEQVLDVAPRFKKKRSLLRPTKPDHYMVRVPQADGTWQDSIMHVPPPPPVEIPFVLEPQALEAARKLPQGSYVLEADFFLMPGAFRDQGERPYFAFMLMAVETQRGMMLSNDMLTPFPSVDTMHAQLATLLLQAIMRVGALPTGIRVRSDVLHGAVKTLARELRFKTKHTYDLPYLDQAQRSLLSFLRR